MRSKQIVICLMLISLLLAGCSSSDRPGAPLPTVILGNKGTPAQGSAQPIAQRLASGINASAIIAPAQEAQLALGVSGRIAVLHVAEGDHVRQGQTLLTLDDQALQAQLAQAQAVVTSAQANYDLMVAGPTTEEQRQAQAALDGAQAALEALRAAPRVEEVAQAQAGLASAQAALALLTKAPSALDLESSRLGIEQARNALWAAQANRDYICGSGNLKESQCDGARAQVLVAETEVKRAQNQLALLQKGADQETIDQAEQAVRIAEGQLALTEKPVAASDLAAAKAQVDGAQAALDALVAGARPEQLEAARTQIAIAKAGVSAAQALLDTLELTAPIDGTVTTLSIHAGQWIIPGQWVATVSDLDALVVETTDLSELDVPGIAVGQAALVNIEALGVDTPGQVSAIAPLADTLGGDVVYQVTVILDEAPVGLRAGMSAEVSF